MKVIDKLRNQYNKKLALGHVPTRLLCSDGLKFKLAKELCKFNRWHVKDGELFIFNTKTRIIFI